MSIRQNQLLIFFGCVLFCSFVSAQSTDLLVIYEKAVSYDAQLAKVGAASQAQEQLTPKSRARLLPNLSLQANTTKQRLHILDNNSNEEFNTHGYSVALTQPIFNVEKWFDLQAANALGQQAKVTLSAEQQNLMSRVANAYFNVLRAQENLMTASAEEKAFQSSLEQIEQRFEVGLTAITDVYDARAGRDSAKVLRIQAETALSISYADLELLTGEEYHSLAILKEEFPLTSPTPNIMDSWVERAIQQNLRIKTIEFNKKAAEARLRKARSGHLPTIDAIASYSHEVNHGVNFIGEKTDRYIVGLELSVPIFQGGLVAASSREAAFLLEETTHELAQVKREIARDTKRLYQLVETDVYRINAAKQALQSRQSALDASEIGYEVGSRNVVDVLQSKSEYFKAKRDYLNARFDYIINSLELKQLVGILSPDDLVALNQWLASSSNSSVKD